MASGKQLESKISLLKANSLGRLNGIQTWKESLMEVATTFSAFEEGIYAKGLINQIEKLTTTVVSKDSEKWRNFTSHYSRLFVTNPLDFNHHLNLIIIWMRGANKLKQGLNSGFENTGLQSRMVSFNKKFPKANIFEVILCIEDVKKHARQNLYMPLILLNMLLDIQKFVYE